MMSDHMRDRRPDTQSEIDRLERRHGELAIEVNDLERRHVFLSVHEQMHVSKLKKEKLATKDALTDLKRMQ